jgi:predicted metal-dependent HD superfamily phosphohydrolase
LRTKTFPARDIVHLIPLTKNHGNGPLAGEGDYFLDAEIAALGAPPNIYNQFMIDVRQAYAWARDPALCEGRSVFLIGAIARSRLFRTYVFEAAYAAQACENMRRELTSIED